MSLTYEEREAILNKDMGGQTLRAMSAISFFQWSLAKIQGLPTYNPRVAEITALATNFFPGRTLSDDQKIDIIQKLREAGAQGL